MNAETIQFIGQMMAKVCQAEIDAEVAGYRVDRQAKERAVGILKRCAEDLARLLKSEPEGE